MTSSVYRCQRNLWPHCAHVTCQSSLIWTWPAWNYSRKVFTYFTGLCRHSVNLFSSQHISDWFIDLLIFQIVGSGHFASVWQGSYQGTTVAVKVFPTWCRQEFTAEREVYGLPHLVHSGIAHFLGAGRKSDSGDCVLLLELATCVSNTVYIERRHQIVFIRHEGSYMLIITSYKAL